MAHFSQNKDYVKTCGSIYVDRLNDISMFWEMNALSNLSSLFYWSPGRYKTMHKAYSYTDDMSEHQQRSEHLSRYHIMKNIPFIC